jgi:uncharacterized membrane protein YkoI
MRSACKLALSSLDGHAEYAVQEHSGAAEGPEQGADSEAADTDDVQDEHGNEEKGSDDGEGSSGLSPDLKARLKEAALAATGGGHVNAMERDGENGGTYEVEVAKVDGSQVDVRLDDQLKVVVIDQDGER